MKKPLHRFSRGYVSVLGILCATGCFTASDLKFYGPEKPFYEVCDKPLGLSDDATVWALDEWTERIWSDDDILELRLHAFRAKAFYQYVETAPESSVTSMPAIYGLKCPTKAKLLPDTIPTLPSSTELLRDNDGSLIDAAETVDRSNAHLFAETTKGKPAGKAPVQATKKVPRRVSVCVRPPWLPKPYYDAKGNLVQVTEWAILLDGKKSDSRWTFNAKDYTQGTATADIIFVFDEQARAESTYYFTKDATKLSCPGKLPTKTFDEVAGSGDLPMLAEVTAAREAKEAKEGKEAKKGDGQTSWTSSPDGKGPPLDKLETVLRQLMFTTALASGDTSGNPKDPNGARYGATNGKNPDGVDSMAVQAVAGAIALIGVPLKSPKAFIEAVRGGLKKGEAILIRDPEFFSKDVAKTLAKEPEEQALEDALKAIKEGKEVALESFGKAMAPALREAKTIMPYSRAEIFTAGWEGKYQAHHLLEVKMGDKVFGMGKQAIDDIPAIILSDAEHKLITNKLAAARTALLGNPNAVPKKQQLWEIYKIAYKDNPNWLKAIEGYFNK